MYNFCLKISLVGIYEEWQSRVTVKDRDMISFRARMANKSGGLEQ